MILVLGSINIDLTTVTTEIPKIGETVIGKNFCQYAGGKGANQAVCAAKLNADVCFLGKVGTDAYGEFMLREMADSGVDVSRIEKSDTSTGIAAISVDAKGQNSIIVVPGANSSLDCAYIDRHIDAIQHCDLLLAQHETPVNVTQYAFNIAKAHGKTTLLNPAPAQEIPQEMIPVIDILVPNEHELSRLTGLSCNSVTEISRAAQTLREQGIASVIVTMGKQGVMLVDHKNERVFPALSVDPVDTTAAGDSFIGGFATSYTKTQDIFESIFYGQLAASYSIRHYGAQSSMPSYHELTVYQNNMNHNG